VIVKNIVVHDKALYIELLLRELCQRGISYVFVENEIHFDKYIFRFYSYDEIKPLKQFFDFDDLIQFDFFDYNSTLYTKDLKDYIMTVDNIRDKVNNNQFPYIKKNNKNELYLKKKFVNNKNMRRR
jgi:hypothetical protein